MGRKKCSIQDNPNLQKKVTFDDIYRDFRRRHPNLKKHVVGYQPIGYMTIKLYLDDGSNMKYDGFRQRAYFMS